MRACAKTGQAGEDGAGGRLFVVEPFIISEMPPHCPRVVLLLRDSIAVWARQQETPHQGKPEIHVGAPISKRPRA